MPGTSTEQVVDKGIRQKSTKEWTHSLTAVPFVRGHRSAFPRTPWNTGVYTCHPTFVTATSGVLTRLPEKLSKNGMRVYTLSDRRLKKKLRVYTASEAKGLNLQAGWPTMLYLLPISTIANFAKNFSSMNFAQPSLKCPHQAYEFWGFFPEFWIFHKSPFA